MTFVRLSAMSLAAVVAALASAASDSHSSPGSPLVGPVAQTWSTEHSSAVSGRVRFVLTFRAATRGTFVASGAISDTGSLKAVRRVVGSRLQLSEVLAGKLGTIRIRAVGPCTGRAGTWRALSGSKAYDGVGGGGTASGGPRCAASTYPLRAIYTGTLSIPPPPEPPVLAQPGRYGGGTSQREEVVFDVDQGGRSLSGLRLSVEAPCAGLTFRARVFSNIPGPNEIAPDRSFSIRSEPNAVSTALVTGRFTSPTTALGTAVVTTTVTVTSTNTTYTCAASATWTASMPPPTATPGRYCGFTEQGPGICLDVAASGREVARVEVGVVVRCQPSSQWELRLVFTGVPVGGHLGFVKSATSFDGLISGSGQVSGVLEPDGTGASGSVRLQLPTFDHEGTRYTCGVGTAKWAARRQA